MDGVNPYTSPSDASILVDDSGHAYDVKIEITVNHTQLTNIINLASQYNSTYNLNSYNCTDFGMSISNAAGFALPGTQGTWPGGGGSNPGDLGQDIRSLTSTQNAIITKTPGTALSTLGICN